MPELLFVKSRGALRPANPESEAAVKSLTVGEVVGANVHPRSQGREYAGRFYALMRLAHEGQDRIEDFDKFVDACLVAGGYFEFAPRRDGSTRKIPVRPSFSRMTEDKFDLLYATTLAVLFKVVGCDDEALRAEIESFLPGAA